MGTAGHFIALNYKPGFPVFPCSRGDFGFILMRHTLTITKTIVNLKLENQ